MADFPLKKICILNKNNFGKSNSINQPQLTQHVFLTLRDYIFFVSFNIELNLLTPSFAIFIINKQNKKKNLLYLANKFDI